MKQFLFCALVFVLFFISCKKEDDVNDNNLSEQYFLVDSIHSYSFKTINDSMISKRSYFSYDSKSNVNQRIKLAYSNFEKKWKGTKYDYEFNDAGNNTMEIYYDLNSNNQWIVRSKEIKTYNSSNQLIKHDFLYYDSYGTIDSGSKSEYILNALGIKTNIIQYSWDISANNWIVSGKVDITTDSSGFPVTSLGYNWGKSTEVWTIYSKGKYKTDLKGNIVQDVDYYTYNLDDKWNVDSILYKYDNNGKQISYESYLDGEHLDGKNRNFSIIDKIDYSYDGNGNLLSIKYFGWDYGFVPTRSSEYVYNANGHLSSTISYSAYKRTSLQPYSRTDYLYNSEDKLTYSISYDLDNSQNKKYFSSIYFSSKHNNPPSSIDYFY